MGVFQGVDASREGVGCVVGQDGAGELRQDGAAIHLFVHQVDADAALSITVGEHFLMHMMTIHARPAMARQQRWVDVDDAVFERCEHGFAYHREEP